MPGESWATSPKMDDLKMKDQDDKQTLEIALVQPKRGRGRPSTGAALTPAQKQKAYRERLKSNVTGKETTPEEVEKLREMARAEFKRAEGLQAQVIDMGLKIAQLEHEVRQLKQSASPSRLNQGMRKIIQDVHDVADALEGSTWRIQRKARADGQWKTLKGSYWNEAKAEDALAEMPHKKGSWWRIIEVKSEIED